MLIQKLYHNIKSSRHKAKQSSFDNNFFKVNKRCISESGRLISDIIEVCEKQNIGGYLVTMDIEKAFDSLDHDFLVHVLNKFGFGSNFISWIKLLLNSQQSCVINGGNTTPYFNLEKGAHQGDLVLAHLFILPLEVLFVFIKSNENIKGIGIFNSFMTWIVII